MLLELLVAVVVLACIAIVIYLLTRSSEPVSIVKKVEAGQIFLRIKAKKDLKGIVVSGTSEQGDVTLRRSNLKAGEEVEFQIPYSQNPIKIMVEDEKGTRSFDQPA